jgi:molybdopterin converting factor small subunit
MSSEKIIQSLEAQLGAIAQENNALVDANRELSLTATALHERNQCLVEGNREYAAEIARFESPNGEGNCRFCGQQREVLQGSSRKCYCIPTIRQYQQELREALAEVQKREEERRTDSIAIAELADYAANLESEINQLKGR